MVSLAGKRGGENRVFPNLMATVDLGEAEPQLAARLALGKGQRTLEAPSQDHYPTLSPAGATPPSLPCQRRPHPASACPIEGSIARFTPLVRRSLNK
jgi:hypothetical protein